MIISLNVVTIATELLTRSFLKEEGIKSTLKRREVPQGGLMAESAILGTTVRILWCLEAGKKKQNKKKGFLNKINPEGQSQF